MKRIGKSSPLLQYVTFSAVFHNIQEMKTCFPACDRKPDLTQLDRRAHKRWVTYLPPLIAAAEFYLPMVNATGIVFTFQQKSLGRKIQDTVITTSDWS